jgi:hypothetical protein
MGVDLNTVRFLADVLALGVDYGATLMIGRQSLNVDPRRCKARLARRDPSVTDADVTRMLTEAAGFAEPLFKWFGAKTVDSMDASTYEQATVIQDLNRPVDPGLLARYTTVFDGGSLEHVFNFPVAIRNCMEMVAPGGHLITCTPANNFFGHGFYQFSPELFYRVLSPENGYEVVRMVMFGADPEARWYEVADPQRVRRRVTLVNSMPTYLAVCARRTRVVPTFEHTPQQSDYQQAWKPPRGGSTAAMPIYSGGPAQSHRLRRLLPRSLRLWLLKWRALRTPLDPECFKRVD